MTTTYDWIQHQGYVLLTTYKRDGTAVPTPMWFATAGGKLYLYTDADAAKVKRIRNNAAVELCPCTLRGKPVGPAVTGRVALLAPDQDRYVHGLLDAKYGWRKRLLSIGGRLGSLVGRASRPDALIEVTLDD